MKLFRLQRTQRLAITGEKAWWFFSDPANLTAITPPWLGLEVVSDLPGEMYPGMIVSYRVRPVAGVPVTWITEISQVRRPAYFVDEQRFGPYRFWHHQHHFQPCPGGTEVTDLVHYGLPLGPVGRFFQRSLVAARLADIFDFRREALARRFGELS